MRSSTVDQSSTMSSGIGFRDAESLFRSKPVTEIRLIESETRKQIDDKKEELRQLIGNQYRDLIDSADSILLMKSSCQSISYNISLIHDYLFSLSDSRKLADLSRNSDANRGLIGSSELMLMNSNPDREFSDNISVIDDDLRKKRELSTNPNPNRVRIYGIASRVKYLVDTPENIWGCLDEFMFLESSARYIRAKLVYDDLKLAGDDLRKNFPLLNHQWQIVESFKGQISQRSREKLMVLERRGGYDVLKVEIGAFADALAGVAIIDELDPREAFGLFLESRKGWILQRLNGFDSGNGNESVVSVLCEVMKIIQVTIAQVGEMFLQVLSDMPLFYKVILDSPPASQLFGGIPNPDEEVRLWSEFRERLESVMVILDREFVARSCSSWLRECGREVVKTVDGKCLIDAILSGAELASAEKLVRETMDSKDVLEGSLEWLKSVFGSDIELPWSRTRELVLEESVDLWDEIFEDAFVSRMKVIIDSGFENLTKTVNVADSIRSVGGNFTDESDFRAYLNRSSAAGGVWFVDPNAKTGFVSSVKSSPEVYDFDSCLSAYFGPEAGRIRDAVDNCCRSVLEDLLSFLDSPKASLRLNYLAPYLQNKCYESTSFILTGLSEELDKLRASLQKANKGTEGQLPAAIIEKSLFIGRLLFAFRKHSKHILLVLGSPREWLGKTRVSGSENLPSISRYSRFSLDSVTPDSQARQISDNARRQSLVANALFGVSDAPSPKLEEVASLMKDLCIAAHGLWISWVSDELAKILSEELGLDDELSATTTLRGWEEVVVKQEPSSESDADMKILLPSLPSLYITSFLFRACEEVHRVGGHKLHNVILRRFAKRLLEKVIDIYSDLVAEGAKMSEKGVLQVLLDLRFVADILSGCDSSANEGLSRNSSSRSAFRRQQERNRSTKSAIRERTDNLVKLFTQKLDPIDWQTFEPYLWENERQSYLRHAVLFGFFVQLNRLYTDTVQKLPTNAESNIMRCSTVPRFKYLPISAPALSSRAATKAPIRTSSDDVSSRGALKAYANGDFSQKIDFDDSSSFGAATPFLKSFMQVGSRFGEGTFKLGSMLTDTRFKDKASAMSSFGDILPVQAAGLLSSFTATRSDS